MLTDIQTHQFFFFRYTDTHNHLHYIQDDEGHHSYEHEGSDYTQCLHAELMEAAAVEQTCFTYKCALFNQIRCCEEACRQRPHIPAIPCTEKA